MLTTGSFVISGAWSMPLSLPQHRRATTSAGSSMCFTRTAMASTWIGETCFRLFARFTAFRLLARHCMPVSVLRARRPLCAFAREPTRTPRPFSQGGACWHPGDTPNCPPGSHSASRCVSIPPHASPHYHAPHWMCPSGVHGCHPCPLPIMRMGQVRVPCMAAIPVHCLF